MNLDGQVAVVTGGASGLGEATARAFAAAGARVAIVDMNGERAALVAKDISGKPYVLDVSNAAAAESFLQRSKSEMGAPRVLVNCAGIGVAKRMVGRDGPTPLEDFSKVINVNLIGSYNMMRLAAGAMIKQDPLGEERGVIISTASVAGYEGQIGQTAYSASKGGIIALTLPAAREMAQFGVRVLAIAPGLFLTPLMDVLPQEAQDSLAAAIPNPRRLGAPEEFAALAKHMVDNAYINGEVVRLDGALRMAPR